METVHINKHWQFHLGDCPEAWDKRYKAVGWKDVTIPHDWAVTLPFSKEYSSGTGYLAGGIGWYRRSFNLPEKFKGKKIRVVFDGVYKKSRVWCNGHYLGFRPNGYVPFRYDISGRVRFGDNDNLLSVKVDHTDIADSRWFTGSGITRKVRIEVCDPVCIEPDGVFFTTPEVTSNHARIVIENSIMNSTGHDVSVTIRSKIERKSTDPNGKEAACFSSKALIPGNSRATVVTQGEITNPALWSVMSPNLYNLTTTLGTTDDKYEDQRLDRVGIRSFLFDPDKGFFLNGVSMKIKGVCVHHDAGCLGAAVPPKVWKRRLHKLKEMGCNAIRMAHNPHMPELYDLCDEMGFLVMDEAFDEWEAPKNKWTRGHNVYPPVHQGYYEDFPEWHERDLRAFLLLHRNHPSIIVWSIGNEIDYPNDPYCHRLFSSMTGNNDKNKPEAERIYDENRPNAERLVPLARRLTEVVKQTDLTRPVTAAVAFPELSSQIGFLEPFDVICYNYKEYLYPQDHARFPQKTLLGSENGHSLENWTTVRDNDYVCGQFLWTGIDFLGEAQGWPVRGSQAGLLTLAGFEKPLYYFRQSLWAEKPVLRIVTISADACREVDSLQLCRRWNYVPGDTVEVRCYTNMDTVELLCNGKNHGAKNKKNGHGYISWLLPYEEGCLQAVGIDSRGIDRISDSLETAHAACAIKLDPWTDSDAGNVLVHDGEDMAQIEVEVTDGQGRKVPGDSTMLHVIVEGPAELIGIENGDQTDLTDYSAPYRRVCDGKMIIYIRSKEEKGKVQVSVRGNGLKTAIWQLH